MLVHITLSTVGRRALAPGPAQLLPLVGALPHPDRLLFAVVDDHLHVVDRAGRPAHRARDLSRRVRAVCPGAELQRAHVRPVEGRSHLERLVGYLLEQPAKHGLATPAALWPGGCFLDLVGARRLGFDPTPLREELPRLRLRRLFQHVGLPAQRLAAADDATLRRVGVVRLLEAAAAVLAWPDPLAGTTRQAVHARALGIQTALALGFPPGALRACLPLTARAQRRLARRPLDPQLQRSLRRRIALELVVGET